MKKLIIPFLFIPAGLIVLTPFLIKVRVECASQFGDCPSQLNSKFETLNSKSIFETKKTVSKIFKNDPQVSDFSFQFKLPNTLKVNLLVVKPEFAIFDKGAGKTYLSDRSGGILGEADSSPLPTIVQDGRSPNMLSLNIIKGVYDMYGVARGEITDSGLVIELPGPVKVIFPVEGADSQVLLGSLRLIYTKIMGTETAGKYSEIDLRFKNPVLR